MSNMIGRETTDHTKALETWCEALQKDKDRDLASFLFIKAEMRKHIDSLRSRLALAEKVVEAARIVCTPDTTAILELHETIKAYDKAKGGETVFEPNKDT